MKMSGILPQGSDAEIPYDLAPLLDPNVNWDKIRKTGSAQVLNAKTYIIYQWGAKPSAQLEIGDVDLSTLNREQYFAVK